MEGAPSAFLGSRRAAMSTGGSLAIPSRSSATAPKTPQGSRVFGAGPPYLERRHRGILRHGIIGRRRACRWVESRELKPQPGFGAPKRIVAPYTDAMRGRLGPAAAGARRRLRVRRRRADRWLA